MPSGLGSVALCVCRIVGILVLTLGTFSAAAFVIVCRLPGITSLHAFYFRYLTWICGLKVVVLGKMCTQRSVLFISNHSSYLDYIILSSLIIQGVFVAKVEIRHWPIIGFCSRLTDVIYIDRLAKNQVKLQNEKIHHYLQMGHRIILFPEGTTSDGQSLLPFKTSLFANVDMEIEGSLVTIQPISVTAVALDDIPIGRCFRSLYAWYGVMDFLSHLWIFLQLGEVTVEVMFHPPITSAEFKDRKEVSHYCSMVIQKGMSDAIRGRVATSTL